jgi:hypothetical protein
MPGGLIFGTLFYSAVWLIPLVCIPALRRHLRLGRGHCPACNYDLRADFAAGCPECGWNREPAKT